MKRLSLVRPIAALALPLLAAMGCVDGGPAGELPRENEDRARAERPDGPEAPALDGATLRVTGADGGSLAIGDDGKLVVEVRLSHVSALRTIGFDVVVEGAEVLEWTREDAFLRSADGKLVSLESRLEDGRLSLVTGTTAPVSTSSDEGALVASLVLAPTASEVRVALDTSGPMRGLLDASGARLDVNTQDARVAAEGE